MDTPKTTEDLAFLNHVIATARWARDSIQAAFELELSRELVEADLALSAPLSPRNVQRATLAALDAAEHPALAALFAL